jgi:ElaB/YqjD/DUF883 family membrane-anchored ribosome-binding protein
MDTQGSRNGEFKAVVEDVKNLKNDSAELAGRMEQKARDGVSSTLGRIEQTVSDIWNAVSKTSTDSYQAVGRNVEQRPITSVLAAFVAGAAFGWVLDRRR